MFIVVLYAQYFFVHLQARTRVWMVLSLLLFLPTRSLEYSTTGSMHIIHTTLE